MEISHQELSNKVAVLEERIKNLNDKFVTNVDYEKNKAEIIGKFNVETHSKPSSDDWDELSGKVIVLEAKVFELESKIDKKVSTVEFSPVKTLVYGAVGLLLIGILGGLARLVLK